MNRITGTLIWVLIWVAATEILSGCNPRKASQDETQNPYPVTIMSYNVRNCLGMDGVTDYKRVADIIQKVEADCVALQELDSATQRSNGYAVLDELARHTGLNAVYAAAIPHQGGKYGIGILTKEKPLASQYFPLPGKEEKRAFLMVEMDKYIICCTHFSLTREDRQESVAIISKLVSGKNKPVFLAGDINDSPDSDVLKLFAINWTILSNTALPTFRSDKPEKTIDYIFGIKSPDYDYTVRESASGNEPVASDHLPIWVKINVENKSL